MFGAIGIGLLFAWLLAKMCIRDRDLWDAIKEMRRLSAEGVPFGFTFMSYDATARVSKGVIEVRHARLLKREKQENHRDAEFVEAYLDLDTCQACLLYTSKHSGDDTTLQSTTRPFV